MAARCSGVAPRTLGTSSSDGFFANSALSWAPVPFVATSWISWFPWVVLAVISASIAGGTWARTGRAMLTARRAGRQLMVCLFR